MRVNVLIIATQKYINFLPNLVKSIRENFLTDCDVQINIFTDLRQEVAKLIDYYPKANIFEIKHQPWPYITLHRYHVFNYNFHKLPQAEMYFYIDADTIIKAPITREEVCHDIVAVQHCGFTDKRGSYEDRPESAAYVAPNEGTHYFGGGFWGFSKNQFKWFLNWCIVAINKDAEKGIIPVWHDESILNRYLIDNPPTKILSPSYHYPENNPYITDGWKEHYECKILLLDKNHSEFQV